MGDGGDSSMTIVLPNNPNPECDCRGPKFKTVLKDLASLMRKYRYRMDADGNVAKRLAFRSLGESEEEEVVLAKGCPGVGTILLSP